MLVVPACASEPTSSFGTTQQALNRERATRLAAKRCNPGGNAGGEVTLLRITDWLEDPRPIEYSVAFATFFQAPPAPAEPTPRGCRILPEGEGDETIGDAEAGAFVRLVDRADRSNILELEGEGDDSTFEYSGSAGELPDGTRWNVELEHAPRAYDGTVATTGSPVVLRDAIRNIRFQPDAALVDDAGTAHLRSGRPLVIRWESSRDYNDVFAFFFDDVAGVIWECASDNDGRLVVPAHVVNQLPDSGDLYLLASRSEQRHQSGLGTFDLVSSRQHYYSYAVER